MPLIKRKPEQS